MSTTNIIRSMIEAAPMTYFMKAAWPGQSTRVTWKNFFIFSSISYCFFNSNKKLENPISIVIPFSWLWGFLSREFVEAMVVSSLVIEVFPESICPIIPMLKF